LSNEQVLGNRKYDKKWNVEFECDGFCLRRIFGYPTKVKFDSYSLESIAQHISAQ
jgi:hypothetical protein